MKKVFIGTIVFGIMSTGMAFANGQNNTGCGLGSVIFNDKDSNSLVLQVLAATTNGTFGNQTFGITSGTSNCGKPANIVKNERLNEFLLANMDGVARDIATGRGESLDTVAELLEIPADHRSEVFARLQNNFSRIFTSEKVVAAEVIDNIIAVINS